MRKKIFKIILIILVVIIIIILVRFYILGNSSRMGKAPGLISGQLAKCPDKPNCVTSEFDDPAHYIPPLNYPASKSDEIMKLLKTVIQEAGGEIVSEENDYISATFSSPIFGFVDDLECRIDPDHHNIQIRSASREGYSDLGANKKRVEFISNLFIKRLNEAN